ncbi:MAG: glutathionylspermidine synthase family protein [Janthinobacterium lividum]
MRRIASPLRPDWRRIVESQGLAYAVDRDESGREVAYWDESAAYEFTTAEADELEAVTEELHAMAITAARRILDDDRLYASLGLPPHAAGMLRRSLAAMPGDQPAGGSLYGRFDFAYDGSGPPLLLEYNADTPAALVEAAVVQWHWLEDVHPELDQVNLLHERLVATWQRLLPGAGGQRVHVAVGQTEPTEDWVTTAYLRDTLREAGFVDVGLCMEDIGWWQEGGRFLDLDRQPIEVCFAMYPWEWMLSERFGPLLDAPSARIRWIEPMWKTLLSSKTLLVALWQEFEGHPNLLPAWLDEPTPGSVEARRGYVAKPVHGWEGAGVRISAPGIEVSSAPGHTAGQALVYQQFVELPDFDGNRPVVGSWMIAEHASGLGVRESTSLITDTSARFVPHYLKAPRSTPEQISAWLSQ